ncbi:tape measure protein [Acinetobacter sp. ANC 3781]
MSGKNLTFKLILDGDSKGLVAAAKQSESTVKAVFNAIKSESDKLKQATESVSKEIGNIVPKGTSELADKLTQSLSAATGIIKNAGDNAKSTAGNFTDFGNKAEKALSQLNTDLTHAKQKLQEFASTNASPADIEKAKVQVDQLEKEVQQADQAFNNFHAEVGKANTKLNETDSAAQTAQKGINGAKFAVNALVGAMAALGIGLGIRELAQVADSYTNLSARINIATRDGGDFISAMSGVHQVALATNSSLEATGSLFTRLNTVGKEMGMTQQNTLDLTKTINQAIQTSGGSAEASEAAVQQFIQAMQGGVLRGEEFNSIMENGYGVAEALAKGLGVTTGELRKMAENGELGAERVYKALLSQKDAVQQTFDKFPTTIGNALTKISTQWQILIGKMDQSNGASATAANWLVTIADNMDVVETLLEDIGDGFIWVGDQLKRIDPATIEALKTALVSAYDAIKSMASALGNGLEVAGDQINTVLGAIFNFNSGVDTAADKTNGLTKLLQALNVAFGFISDGFSGIAIVANLLTGVFYDVSAAWYKLKSNFTWGDTKKEAIADMEAMAVKAQEYYDRASNGAMDFKSKGIAAIQEIGKTEEQKNTESVASSKIKLDQLLAHQQTEVNGKKVTEAEKLSAVQAYAEAAIAANNGVMDGTMQADLMTKGYIVTLDQSGKVSVQAWNQNKEGAESTANATDKARKAATALGLDLDVSLNRVSEKFKAGEANVNSFVAGLEGLGVTGKQAGDVTYEAWLKWLEAAKSQAEIDAAKAKLQEFGDQGQISTSQVEQGLIAIKLQAQKLPDDIDPVTEAFKRLGIETKANLKLAAQQALMDYITIRDSGKATAEGVENAYRKAAQAAAASGDAGVVASTNAANAGRNLEVQIDSTGKAVVKTMDEWSKSNDRVRNSAERIGDGYRHAGSIAREEAKSSTEAWSDAVAAASKQFDAEMKRQSKSLSNGIYNYNSYSKADVLSQLKSKGYSDKEAEKLAGTIWSEAMAADRAAKEDGLGKDGNLGIKALINQEFDAAAAKGLTTQWGTNKINDLLRQMTASNLVSTGPSTKPVDVNSLAPNVSAPVPSTPTVNASKSVNYNISFGGQTLSLSGSAEQESMMNQLINQLKTQAKST